MKKYLYLLGFLLLIPAIYVYATDGVSGVEHPAKVNSVVTPDKVCGVSGLAAGNGGPDVWYYGVGSDTYAQSSELDDSTSGGDEVTCAAGGTLTKVSVKVDSTGTSNNIKIALYYDVAGTWTLHECGEVAIGAGWNDRTLGSSYSVDASETVLVIVTPDGVNDFNWNSSETGHYSDGWDLYPTCPATTTISSDWALGARVYVD